MDKGNCSEMRITPKHFQNWDWTMFANWLETLDVTHYICSLETKNYATGSPVEPHYHLFFYHPNIQQQAIRRSFKEKSGFKPITKLVPNSKGKMVIKAEPWYKLGIIKKDTPQNYIRYCCKHGNFAAFKGFTQQELDDFKEAFEQQWITEQEKKKEEKKNKTKVTRIKEYMDLNKIPIYTVSNAELMFHIIKYHLDRDVLFTEFDLKRIHNYIKVERMTDSELWKYAQRVADEL